MESTASSTSPAGPIILNTSNLVTSDKFFGILAGNITYAEGIIRNFISSGHKLFIWSRNSDMNEALRAYAERRGTFFRICPTPSEVVKNSEIIFSCLSNPTKAQLMINNLVDLSEPGESLSGKGYVEMTSIGPELSQDFSELVTSKGGTYLEAMLQGNKTEANESELVVLAAGSPQLFQDCQSCFKAMAKAAFLQNKIGAASSTHMICQMIRGVLMTSLAEGFALANRSGVRVDKFNNIFKETNMASEYLKRKGDVIVNRNFNESDEPLLQLQQDLRQGLDISEIFTQPMQIVSNANEVLKHSRKKGDDDMDSASVYTRMRF